MDRGGQTTLRSRGSLALLRSLLDFGTSFPIVPDRFRVRFLDRNAIQQKPCAQRALRPSVLEISAPPTPDFPFLADFRGRVCRQGPPHFLEAEFQNYGSVERV
jgi:hypothetical protein